MPFFLIKGHFKPEAGIPDGDSVRFIADDPQVWQKLEGRDVKLGSGAETLNTVQLRFEAIDAIEKGATKPLSVEARDSMFKLLGYDTVSQPQPRGYILARMTDDKTGRPICFTFAGETDEADGAEVFLDSTLLKRSANYQQTELGYAYPLYYNTLFAALRNTFNQALKVARQRTDGGYWPYDRTTQGVTVTSHDDLKIIPPIWPKLWRRLDEFFRGHDSLDEFIPFLAKKNERIDVLDIMEERGLQDLVEVKGNFVRLLEPPENLRVVGKAGSRNR